MLIYRFSYTGNRGTSIYYVYAYRAVVGYPAFAEITELAWLGHPVFCPTQKHAMVKHTVNENYNRVNIQMCGQLKMNSSLSVTVCNEDITICHLRLVEIVKKLPEIMYDGSDCALALALCRGRGWD